MPKKQKRVKQASTRTSKGNIKASATSVDKLNKNKASAVNKLSNDGKQTEGKRAEGKQADSMIARANRLEGKQAEGKQAEGKRAKGKRLIGKQTEGIRAEEKRAAGRSGKHVVDSQEFREHARADEVSEDNIDSHSSKAIEESSQSTENKCQDKKSEASNHHAADTRQRVGSKPARRQGGSKNEELHPRNYEYSVLQQACARSTNMRGKLRQQQANIAIELPDALPSTLLLRALQRNRDQYQTLSEDRIAPHDQQSSQVSLQVAGLSETQLHSFIRELDELIGQFTGRN